MPEQPSKKSEKTKAAFDTPKPQFDAAKTEDIENLQKFGKKLSHPKIHWSRIFRFDIFAVYALVIFICSVLIVGTGILAVDLLGNVKERKELNNKKEVLMKEKKNWEEATSKYTDYRDGYFKLATINYQLGNIESARINLKKTLDLDPNFEAGRELEKLLQPQNH